MFDDAGKQPYITAVYDKVDAIRFEVFMQCLQAVVTPPKVKQGADAEEVATELAVRTELLMKAALDKMEGLEIIQRAAASFPPGTMVLTCNECNGTQSPEILHLPSCSQGTKGPTCPVCGGDGVLY
jgi:hypothetical protein